MRTNTGNVLGDLEHKGADRWEEAKAAFAKALEINPTNEDATSSSRNALRRHGLPPPRHLWHDSGRWQRSWR